MKSVVYRTCRSARRHLMGGAGAAALLLGLPAAAQAADECGAVEGGQVTCPADGDYRQGISYAVDPAERQDLTVRLGEGLTLVTEGDEAIGVHAANLNGSVAIEAGGAHVATGGRSATGLSAVTYHGDIRIEAASVTTAGEHAHGVVASTSAGDIDLRLGSVAVHGYDAYGVVAFNDAPNDGAVTVVADSIVTHGAMGDGVNVFSLGEGGVQIDVDTVSTGGEWAFGLNASGAGSVAVRAGSVSTQGAYGLGVQAVSLKDVTIGVGQVSTAGDYAVGLTAVSWDGAVTLQADRVTTRGVGASGVDVILNGYLGRGIVDVGSIVTSGESADGLRLTAQLGGFDVVVDEVTTKGAASRGVAVSGAFGDSSLTVGRVVTEGEFARAVDIFVENGTGQAVLGEVTTRGDRADGVGLSTRNGQVSLLGLADINTFGARSNGVAARAVFGGVEIETRGDIHTRGDSANGMHVFAFQGAADVRAVGAVTTTGAGSAGLYVEARDSQIALAADQIDTFGAGAHGVRVEIIEGDVIIFDRPAPTGPVKKPDGKSHDLPGRGDAPIGAMGGPAAAAPEGGPRVEVTTGTVRVRGAGSVGLLVNGDGEAAIDAGLTSSVDAQAIKAKARGQASVRVRNAATSETTEAVSLTGADVVLDVAAGAEIRGATDGVVLSAVGPYVPPEQPPAGLRAGPGTVTVTNAGRIRGGGGHALVVTSGDATVVNTGRIEGSIGLAGGDDVIDNRGLFLADRDSEFGGGDDRFTNAGVLAVEGAASFVGLETFQNQGLIDLQNGTVGDSLTLSGDYQAGDDARVALDVSLAGGASDRLVVAGSASGDTRVVLADVEAAEARLTAGAPITLVQVQGGGSGRFVVDESSRDIGFVRYGLRYDEATASYRLASTAGAAVRRTLKAGEGAQSAWLASADGWAAHLAGRRDDGAHAGPAWAQLYGSTAERDEVRTVAVGGGEETFDLGYEQTTAGGQIGVDLGERALAGGTLRYGVTGGYADTGMTFGSAERLDLQTLNLGGYAAFSSGRLFADALVKYDLHALDLEGADGLSDEVQGGSLGVLSQAGVRFGTARLFVEPVVRLAYVRSEFDAVETLGQRLVFDDRSGWIVGAGARVGGERDLAGGRRLAFYVGGDVARELGGEAGLEFFSGGLSERVDDFGPDAAVARGVLGASLALPSGVTLQVEGSGAFGDDHSGAGLRVGGRFSF